MTDAFRTGFAAQPPESFGFTHIRYEKNGWLARVTINRPEKHNALAYQTLRELERAFLDAAWDDAIAVVVVTGAGDQAFSTGGDVDDMENLTRRPHDYWKWVGAFFDAQDRLRNIGKPTIARINGIVVGGGNEFNIGCDLAVMADDTYIRQIGAARGSVAAAGATQFLPLIVGDRRAREILFLCEEIPAQKALEWGLVNKVVPRKDLDAAVQQMAETVYAKLPNAIRYTKEQMNFWRHLAWGLTIGHAREWLTLNSAMPETAEGMSAFLEKRQPDYAKMHDAVTAGRDLLPWGPYTRTCAQCGADALPESFTHCGKCGAALK